MNLRTLNDMKKCKWTLMQRKVVTMTTRRRKPNHIQAEKAVVWRLSIPMLHL